MANDELYKPGTALVAKESYAYCITEGKVYTVVKYEPRCRCDWFTYPEYVTIVDDHGDHTRFYTWRFKVADQDHNPAAHL